MILHIMTLDKFLPPFINFLDEHFTIEDHKFVFINDQEYKYGLTPQHNVEFLNSDEELVQVLEYMNSASKIILHGLWRDRINTLLLENKELIQKCFWIMWGGDFYFPEKQSEVRKQLIPKIPYLVTGTSGEIDYVREHYNAIGKHIQAFVYTSNLYKEVHFNKVENDTINILVGNSANPTNNHFEVFEKLEKYKNRNIKIYVPLSYDDQIHAKKVITMGKELFEDKFHPLTDYMNEQSYYQFLSTIDIALFNHNRQQGMGNIITLLGMGKTVYMRDDVSTWNMFKEQNITLLNIKNFNLKRIEKITQEKNMNYTKQYFSVDNFKKQIEAFINSEVDYEI